MRVIKKLVLAFGIISSFLLEADSSRPVGMTPRQQEFMNIAASTRIFKQIIVDGDIQAFNTWFKPDALKKWNKLTAEMIINNSNPGMIDFFKGSVIFYGSFNEQQSVVGLYNPWVDGLLVLLMDNSDDVFLVDDFVLISGESLRGKKIGNPLSILLPGKEPFSVPIWRNFAKMENIFKKIFPKDSKKASLHQLTRISMSEELVVINARIAMRFKLISVFLGDKYLFCREQAKVVKSLITLELTDQIDLKKYFDQNQNKVVLNTFFKLPYQVREGMKLYCFVPGKTNAILIFINPGLPRFVASVEVDKNKKPTIEWYDLFNSDYLYKSWKK